MGNKSPTPVAQTTTFTPGGQSYFDLAQPFAQQFASAPPQMPDFPLVAGFDPAQIQGQEMALGAASGPQTNIASNAATMAQFLSGDVLYPESNPALTGHINAAVRPITEQLTQNILPNIRNTAESTGNFGSSRQGIAEGLASQGASRAVGDTTSRIASQAYGQGLDAFTKNLQLAPQTAALQTIPALTTSGVGDVRQALAQQMLGEQTQRFNWEQMLPLLMARELTGIGAAIPGGTSTTTATTAQPNKLMGGLGGALSGAMLGNMLFPGAGLFLGAGLGGAAGSGLIG